MAGLVELCGLRWGVTFGALRGGPSPETQGGVLGFGVQGFRVQGFKVLGFWGVVIRFFGVWGRLVGFFCPCWEPRKFGAGGRRGVAIPIEALFILRIVISYGVYKGTLRPEAVT